MFRRKDDLTDVGPKVRPASRAVETEIDDVDDFDNDYSSETEVVTTKSISRPGRNSSSASRKVLWWSLAVLVLLAVGWGGARLIIHASENSGSTNFLSALFGGGKLEGEDRGSVNFLILGMPGEESGYDGPTLTDTFMVGSMNVKDKKVTMFSLPRDLYVNVPANGGEMKLNSVYAHVQSSTGDGIAATKAVASQVLGVPIDYYVKINFDGFEQVIDELGGITVTVDKDLFDPLYPDGKGGYKTVDIKAGTYKFDGATALEYARSRQTTSDFDRAKRQQKIILAVREKASSLDMLKSPRKAIAIYNIVKKNVETDLSLNEMERVASLGKELDPNNVATKVFDDSPSGMLYATRVGEAYALKPVGDNYNAIHKFVMEAIAGKVEVKNEEPKAQPLKLEVLNGTTITGLAGKVADLLKTQGHTIIKTGNNATRGFTKTTVYDLSEGKRTADIAALAASLGATVSTEKVTSTSGAEARVVVGEDKNVS